ncbi:hypothetical protein K440DRAFT_34228 [Wilcoxina mikolae CBS 423.85]|nr:hypothetical protein K440DRAFT_34228 [Wilcoxina mikolae CBS 423.85]
MAFNYTFSPVLQRCEPLVSAKPSCLQVIPSPTTTLIPLNYQFIHPLFPRIPRINPPLRYRCDWCHVQSLGIPRRREWLSKVCVEPVSTV